MNNIAYWKDKPLHEYTKEQLIEIIVELSQLYDQNIQEHLRQLKVLKG